MKKNPLQLYPVTWVLISSRCSRWPRIAIAVTKLKKRRSRKELLLGRKGSHSRERREAGYLWGSDIVASCRLLRSFDSKVPSSSNCRLRMSRLFILTQFELSIIHINTESLSKAPLWSLKAKLITALPCSQVMIAQDCSDSLQVEGKPHRSPGEMALQLSHLLEWSLPSG